jgi:hypothetical protein
MTQPCRRAKERKGRRPQTISVDNRRELISAVIDSMEPLKRREP